MSRVLFKDICNVFESLENLSSRNDMTKILVEAYSSLTREDGEILSYVILGRVAPLFVMSEFNYSEKSLLNLLNNHSQAIGLDIDIADIRRQKGDLGDVLKQTSERLNFKGKGLSLFSIYEILWEVVNITGTGSVERKNSIVLNTLKSMSPLECKYFVRIICGSLRFGLNHRSLLDVFSTIAVGDKSLREGMDLAYGYCADIGYLYSKIYGKSAEETKVIIENVEILPGVPVMARLVERVGSMGEAVDRMGGEFLVQNKFDGLRCQIHKYYEEKYEYSTVWKDYLKTTGTGGLFDSKEEGCRVKLFTRNLEDITDMFPEIVESAKNMKEESFILDSEVMGMLNGEFLPFQETMKRRRKYGVDSLKSAIPVKAMCFDILYLNGKPIAGVDTEKRVGILRGLDTQGGILVADTYTSSDEKELGEIFNKSVLSGYEGVIVKRKRGGYLPGARNYEWIKLKKSLGRKVVDTLDLVAVGYSYGSGRRNKLGVGSVLGAVYDDSKGIFVPVTNVGTGFTDELLKDISKVLEDTRVDSAPKSVFNIGSLDVDVWVEPKIVFTIDADEVTMNKSTGNISVRFPRLIEWGRDKGVYEVTTLRELEALYGKLKGIEMDKEKV